MSGLFYAMLPAIFRYSARLPRSLLLLVLLVSKKHASILASENQSIGIVIPSLSNQWVIVPYTIPLSPGGSQKKITLQTRDDWLIKKAVPEIFPGRPIR
jgi:hypothetical protein